MVKRVAHSSHWRRRRIDVPSSAAASRRPDPRVPHRTDNACGEATRRTRGSHASRTATDEVRLSRRPGGAALGRPAAGPTAHGTPARSGAVELDDPVDDVSRIGIGSTVVASAHSVSPGWTRWVAPEGGRWDRSPEACRGEPVPTTWASAQTTSNPSEHQRTTHQVGAPEPAGSGGTPAMDDTQRGGRGRGAADRCGEGRRRRRVRDRCGVR